MATALSNHPDPHAEYKQALSRMVASVAVVTVQDGWRARAVTVTSLVSVSLEPPLVAVCLSKYGKTSPLLAIGKEVGISVLSSEQATIARRFSARDRGFANFHEEEGVHDWQGVWVFEDSSAWFAARVDYISHLGDHIIYVLRVDAAASGSREVLSYFDRDYGASHRLSGAPS